MDQVCDSVDQTADSLSQCTVGSGAQAVQGSSILAAAAKVSHLLLVCRTVGLDPRLRHRPLKFACVGNGAHCVLSYPSRSGSTPRKSETVTGVVSVILLGPVR